MKASPILQWLLALVLAPPMASAAATAGAEAGRKPGHVFIIVLENEGYRVTFGDKSPAAYLKMLAQQGALLPNYYGIGHYSLDNYLALVSGQAPNPVTQADCQSFVDFVATGTTKEGQAIGTGCVYPASVSTIANQLEAKGLSWKAYMEDMGNDLSRDKSATCAHPEIGQPDGTQKAVAGDQYASRHDPFVYFHSIIDQPTCAAHVVNLSALATDLADAATTPSYAFITPNLCHDGHDGGGAKTCVDGQPGGLVSADKFLADTVPGILASPAFKHDGLLIVTFDEADSEGGDATRCCREPRGPNIKPGAMLVFGPTDKIPDRGPGVTGPGGGRIGAVLLSPFIKPGTVSKAPYNHYALLRSIEDFFGLAHLGYAGQKGLKSFGRDIFNASGPEHQHP
jgi:phosphatidylinositol-3-phosphatase